MENRDQQPLHVAVVVCQTRAALNWLVHVTFVFNPYGRVVNLCGQHIAETSRFTSTRRASIHGKVGKCVQRCWFKPFEVVGGRCCRLVKEPSRPQVPTGSQQREWAKLMRWGFNQSEKTGPGTSALCPEKRG